MPARLARPAQTTVLFIATEHEVEGKSWEDLATRLKATAAKKTAQEATHRLRVFNRLGADGWELVGHQGGESIPTEEVWTFKRKVAK